jgi:hypothetical protein
MIRPRTLTMVALIACVAAAAMPASALAVIPCDQNQPPIIDGFMNPAEITENHHKYAAVQAIILVADDDSGPVVTELVGAVSSEPDSGLGKGDKPNDIMQVGLYEFQVRAELGRDSSTRTYTLTYRATDGCGVASETSVTVTVLARR